MNKLNVNGHIVEVSYTNEQIETIFMPLLQRWIDCFHNKQRRIIVYLAACPGSGKSTLALFLEQLFSQIDTDCSFQSIGMDGFHFSNAYLKTHHLEQEKGSANTFDVQKLKKYIEQTKEEDTWWPVYSRLVHEPVDHQVLIQSDIVLIEGNYLLSKESPWNELMTLCDDSIFFHVPVDILKERLIFRKSKSIGMEKAIDFYHQSDSKNIEYVLNTKRKANIEFSL